MPDLDFSVERAAVVEHAAVPTLRFDVRLENRPAEQEIRSVSLNTQIRISATRRHYAPSEQDLLLELFGEPGRWRDTLRSLLWTHATVHVPPFTGSALVEIPVACTYDLEVVAAKYLHALEDGKVPLEFLFSGTVFYATPDGRLQVERIPWDREAEFGLPVRLWRAMIERYYPNSAWIRLHRDAFDRLYEYKAERGLPTWEAAVEALLQASEQEVEP